MPPSVAGDVGFAHLPNQIHREAVEDAFEFTVMAVGQSGLGKSTLLNSLFAANIYEQADYGEPGARLPSTASVQRSTVTLEEGGVSMNLTVVDTPGFGNAIDNQKCWEPLLQDIDSAFGAYLDAESKVERTKWTDARVHCCLYFIAPTGHGLKPLDAEVMSRLQHKVNIVPVIAKADTMTQLECDSFKEQLRADIEGCGIRVYQLPALGEEEEEVISFPLAVSSSTSMVDGASGKTRGRKYPWGVIETTNALHSDFSTLRDMVTRTHTQHLIDTTNDVHYERFRSAKLSEVASAGGSKGGGDANEGGSNSFLEKLAKEKELHAIKMEKMEKEMTQVFDAKVSEKEAQLRDKEQKLLQQHDHMKRQLQHQHAALTKARQDFEAEKAAYVAERDRAAEAANSKGKKSKK